MKNKKSDKAKKEKAQKEAEKRVKDFEKIKKKMDKRKEKDVRKMEEDRRKMAQPEEVSGPLQSLDIRRDSRFLYGQSPAFSELTHTVSAAKRPQGIVSKKILHKKAAAATIGRATQELPSGFKVGETSQDGKRSVRNINGLRRDSEVMYISNFDDEETTGNQQRIINLFLPKLS